MGEFNKEVLKSWAEYECQRQIFLHLGQHDHNWIRPFRTVTPLQRARLQKFGAHRVGKEYEKAAFNYIENSFSHVHCQKNDQKVTPFSLTPSELKKFKEKALQTGEPQLILEASFPVAKSLMSSIFQSDPCNDLVQTEPQTQRPDILVLQAIKHMPSFQEGELTELLADGTTRLITPEQHNKVAIMVVDVKATIKEKVSKKYWMELFFYAHSLVLYIKEKQLDQEFVVLTHGHGIFPYFDQNLFPIVKSWSELQEHLALLKWKESHRLYTQAIDVFTQLNQQKPCSINSIPVHIQPACGRCEFLDDCKESLGMNQSNAGRYDVRLIPNTNASIADQLRQKGIKTVQDVVSLLPAQDTGDMPDPLYPEKPLLLLKANSLKERKHYPADLGHIKSMAIPEYSDITLTFNLEHDPICDRVFNIAFHWAHFLSPHRHSRLYSLGKNLWQLMYEVLETKEKSFSEVLSILKKQGHQQFNEENLTEIKNNLESIQADPNLNIMFSFENKNDVIIVNIEGAFISPNLEVSSELELLQQALQWLSQILDLSTSLENILAVSYDSTKENSWIIHPKTSIFHWSSDALTAFGNLAQRHLKELLLDTNTAMLIERISRWLAPSESSISNDKHASKIYDLKLFVEHVVGLPFVLNYTWHEIYRELFKTNINQKYWTPHFNYIDFATWHEAIEEESTRLQKKFFEQLNQACLFKVIALNRLRTHFQTQYRHLTSKTHRTLPSEKFEVQTIPHHYHKLAQSWYLFALLDESASQLEAEFIRLNYPEWSIGKLRAAKGEQVNVIDIDEKSYICELKVRGISTNMKFKEDDEVILLPEKLRYESKTSAYQLKIKSLEWIGHESCFLVRMEKKNKQTYKKEPHLLYESLCQFQHQSWYMYPTTLAYWAKRLENGAKPQESLLGRRFLGSSWLGHHVAKRILGTEYLTKTPVNTSSRCNQAEVFMYQPTSLNILKTKTSVERLTSSVKYPPDYSQKEAILLAMNHTISAIQGPPGTGKSQTITTLLDEMLRKANQEQKSLKILVSAFSYQALQVLLHKTSSLTYSDGTSSLVKQCKKVFMRSDTRDPVSTQLASDLVGKKGSSWKIDGQAGAVKVNSNLLDHLPETFILFAPPNQCYHLGVSWMNSSKKNPQPIFPFPKDFGFDVILVDEASQLPVDQCLPLAHLLKPLEFTLGPHEESEIGEVPLELLSTQTVDDLTKVIFVGDHHQLPPVQSFEPPKQLQTILGSAFEYFVNQLGIPYTQLKVNYRSHQHLVDYTRSLELYPELTAYQLNATTTLAVNKQKLAHYPEWIQNIFIEERIIHCLTHTQQFDTAVSSLEAELTQQVVLAYHDLADLQTAEEEHEFWEEGIGVVAPHNAHGKLIIRGIYQTLVSGTRRTKLADGELMKALTNTIFSVEKFQGSDRKIMIASMGISAKSQLQSEEVFIYDLNRFNVLTSRAKSKMILVCSQNYLDYFPKDQTVFAHAAKIRSLVYEFCTKASRFNFKDKQRLEHELTYRYYDPQS